MPLPLPDLDTRSFADFADEARASIPRFARGWTDHNLSDPGITITELLAAELDRLMYAVNRITDRDRRTLLRLLGFPPLPPAPARTVLAFTQAQAVPTGLPAGLVWHGAEPGAEPVPYRTVRPVQVHESALSAVQTQDGNAFFDATAVLRDGDVLAALGTDPDAGRDSSLVLGFDPAPAAGIELSLWLQVEDAAERDAIEAELGPAARLEHHDARAVWEWYDGSAWSPVSGVEDETRALTVSGAVRLQLVPSPPVGPLGASPAAAAWIRCRLASGRLDTPPRLSGIEVNAVEAVQAVPAVTRFVLAPGCAVPAGQAPVAGVSQPLTLSFDTDGRIDALAADPAGQTPPVEVLEYTAATAGAPGHLLAAVGVVGRGAREPGQVMTLPGGPVVAASVRAWVAPAGETVRLVPSLDAATPHELAAVLDPGPGTLTFGDGRRGRMLAPGERVFAAWDRTAAAAGTLRPHTAYRLGGAADDANGARLAGPSPAAIDLAVAAAAPLPASAGADAEGVVQAAGRASRRLFAHERLLELVEPGQPATLDGVGPAALAGREPPERATNGVDLERIVRGVPGCRVARARAWPALDARYPGLEADGTATVVILPELPATRPEPSPGLLQAVRRVVERRRLVASRIVVAGPAYVEMHVRARLHALVGRDPADVAAAAHAALDTYLHPLTGGRDGRGWPFGRDVYRPEILGVLDGADGVDYVVSLDLVGPDGATCGNVCLPPTALVAAGPHELEVET